tara:strand:- start:60 stop:803 length:744 start_codon:yes stop_codon:yes gene_type:complete
VKNIFFKFFGVIFNGDNAMYDRYIWLKKNLVVNNEKSNLLDIGCGNGWALFLSKKLGFNKIVGLSWDKQELEKIKNRSKIAETFEIIVGDARKLDKINFYTKFDAIINFENIEHIINDEKLIKDISDLLNTRGLLYLTTPNNLFKSTYGDTLIKNPPVEDGSHVVRGYSKERLEKLMNKYNLKIISTSFIGGMLSRNLLKLERIFKYRFFKILIIPLKIITNFLDNIFFKNNTNNTSIAVIAEKFED